ncbi:MAG: glycosyltransferase family 9 protein [Candidatus Firestonebacteria bacterium]
MINNLQDRILVCRTDRIGDVILALPVITNLRLNDKHACIDFLGAEYSKKILEDNPYLDGFLVYEPKGRHAGIRGLFNLVKELRGRKYDKIIHVFPRFKLSLAAFLAGIPLRVGPSSKWYSFFYNKRAAIHRSRVEKHELEYNLDLLKPLNIPIKDKKLKLWLNSKDKKFASDFFKKNKLSGKVIAVHPGGASGSMFNWGLVKYSKLIDTLQEKLKIKVLLIEGKDEEFITKDLFLRIRNRPPVLKGSADIKQLGAVLTKTSVLISKNTGTMHIAAAVQTPTISFFSPVYVISEKRWGPRGNKALVLKPKIKSCRKCTGENCIYFDCVNTIKLEEVIEKVKLFL